MSVYRIARGFRSTLAHCPREFHLRPVHHLRGFGLAQPIRIVQHIRTQKYSTDESISKPDDLANRVTKLEKSFSTTMEDGFKKLKDELKDELKETLEKSLATTNDGIKDLRAWVRWIVGTFGLGLKLELKVEHQERLLSDQNKKNQ
ncbi:uncharacterized protein LAJ45_08038 [Morchella importuna]|uniref:uncharacterized protein n=1 Tax=Morchella importuna TaxID=1174673 RepID=UPI001E8E6C2F|nr:uncharacterized protein LAJ45_08038 [Morchella importuna]KAH8147937.1 hypothetical protein LAJ45_08038 [Morchella importuna]